MENLLKQLNLSEGAFKIYNECLGNPPLTYQELLSLNPDSTSEEFNNILNELINLDLLVKIDPQNQEILSYYFALPPFAPALTLYSNVNVKIKSLQEIIINALNKIFQEKNKLGLDDAYNKFLEVKKEHANIVFVHKQNLEDNIKEIEKVNEIPPILNRLNEIISGFNQLLLEHQQRIKGITQAQLGNLAKILSSIRTQLEIRIKSLEHKTIGEEILNIIEETFTKEFQHMVEEFTDTIYTLIDLEFKELTEKVSKTIEKSINKKIGEPIKTILKGIFELPNKFKLISSNLTSELENKTQNIQDLILANNDSLVDNLQNLEQSISESLNAIVQDFINQVSELNKPIENVIQQFLERNPYSDKMKIDNVWIINSRFRINEEISNLINNSKEEIILILPKIEGYLKKEQVQNLPKTLTIKIATSDSHTDNIINKLMEIKNVEFRSLTNENTIALKGDQNYIIFGLVKKDSENILNDIIGIGSNFGPLIEIFTPLIETSWSVAKIPPTPKPEIRAEPKFVVQTGEVLVSKVEPKPEDNIGAQINIAFNKLIEKLNSLQGYEFSNELQKISDLIVGKVGFSVSVTLHKISTMISIYKPKYADLDNNDRAQIFTSIESWKQEIFSKTGMHI